MRHWLIVLILHISTAALAKPVELLLWHSFAGHLGGELNHLVETFNRSQPDVVIKPVYKGEYSDSITSYAAAFQAGQAPAIIQIYEVGTATMLSPAGIIKPLHELMQEQGMTLPLSSFLPAIRSFYSKKGEIQALPLNTSIPVMFYNADALAKAGVKEEEFPKTWQEMPALAEKLKKAGFACAYTTAYPAWIQIESFSALHGLPMMDVSHGQAIFNHPEVIHHLERLLAWQTKHYFEYGGRASDANVLFTSGRCALFSQSSGSYRSLVSMARFRMGVAALPMDSSVSLYRHNNVIGGAALWTTAGLPTSQYQGVARFYEYLARKDVQQRWQENTGYIPLGLDGFYAGLGKDTPSPVPGLARYDLSGPVSQSVPPFGIPHNQIRMINDEALEAIFAGIKSPEEAMNAAVARANASIMRFARNTGRYVG